MATSSTSSSLCSPYLSLQNLCTAATPNPSPFGVSFLFRSRSATGLKVSDAPPRLHAHSTRQLKAGFVTQSSWDKVIAESEVPVLVEFYASWCGPCRMVHRIMGELAEEYNGKVKCLVVNTDEDLEIAERYEIKAVPVVLFLKNGKKRECVVGTMPKDFYVAAINRVMDS